MFGNSHLGCTKLLFPRCRLGCQASKEVHQEPPPCPRTCYIYTLSVRYILSGGRGTAVTRVCSPTLRRIRPDRYATRLGTVSLPRHEVAHGHIAYSVYNLAVYASATPSSRHLGSEIRFRNSRKILGCFSTSLVTARVRPLIMHVRARLSCARSDARRRSLRAPLIQCNSRSRHTRHTDAQREKRPLFPQIPQPCTKAGNTQKEETQDAIKTQEESTSRPSSSTPPT